MIKRLMACAAIALLAASPMAAQKAAAKPNPLLKDAKITRQAARETALARVPGGKVRESELEMEKGTLVWSFDIKVKGKSGVDEVLVNAITGEVVSVEKETPADETARGIAGQHKSCHNFRLAFRGIPGSKTARRRGSSPDGVQNWPRPHLPDARDCRQPLRRVPRFKLEKH